MEFQVRREWGDGRACTDMRLHARHRASVITPAVQDGSFKPCPRTSREPRRRVHQQRAAGPRLGLGLVHELAGVKGHRQVVLGAEAAALRGRWVGSSSV